MGDNLDDLNGLNWIEIIVDRVEEDDSTAEEDDSTAEEDIHGDKYVSEQKGKVQVKKVLLKEGYKNTNLSIGRKEFQSPSGLYQFSSVTEWFGEEKGKNIMSQKEKIKQETGILCIDFDPTGGNCSAKHIERFPTDNYFTGKDISFIKEATGNDKLKFDECGVCLDSGVRGGLLSMNIGEEILLKPSEESYYFARKVGEFEIGETNCFNLCSICFTSAQAGVICALALLDDNGDLCEQSPFSLRMSHWKCCRWSCHRSYTDTVVNSYNENDNEIGNPLRARRNGLDTNQYETTHCPSCVACVERNAPALYCLMILAGFGMFFTWAYGGTLLTYLLYVIIFSSAGTCGGAILVIIFSCIFAYLSTLIVEILFKFVCCCECTNEEGSEGCLIPWTPKPYYQCFAKYCPCCFFVIQDKFMMRKHIERRRRSQKLKV